jgi:REP element-mobilizing transposase RayT
MTLPRSVQVDPSATPYYHCVSRCVRRAYLCGRDALTGYNFEHRRAWLEQRLHELAGIFAIDLCAYAVMSNHYHVVLHLNPQELEVWDDEEVIARWQRLHRLPEGFDTVDPALRARLVSLWRERLGSLSWFMKCVNEPLARLANREDGCKGRFWEGRFRSQALLDEAAVIKAMAYVDLNPVRAGVAATPEASDHTSVQARIEQRDAALAPMAGQEQARFSLPMALPDYLALVDYTGRALRRGKRGRIDPALRPILERLEHTSPAGWLAEMAHLSRRYCRAIGSALSLRNYRDFLGQQRLNGVTG